MSHENFDFSIDDKVAYNSEIQECFSVWDNLKLEVQEKKRYFSDISTFNWEVYIKSNAKISKGNIFYWTFGIGVVVLAMLPYRK